MTILPLGDQAVLAYCADEESALRLAAAVRSWSDPWLVDVVSAYTTVAVFFDLRLSRWQEVADRLRHVGAGTAQECQEPGQRHEIPCCYELGPDLERVAKTTGLTADEVIALHTQTEYTVYAIGFSPGFPYLGYLPPPLCGVPRLPQPRLRVEAGSVGLTGRQTGIYPEPRPGGWNLIGRTPLQLVDVVDGYFPLRTGDRVRFVRIDEAAFRRLLGERLPGAPRPLPIRGCRPGFQTGEDAAVERD
ncbi:MAG: 5-oxoprolinase subunit PxpB [Gemmataceae bacterium]|nr:5-oxoprolinase subunit PxpB [Gemmataceae bacterium]MDW8265058.1 5-oxoprolinase subunit PxpB [Gemmataceae bacterium]